MSESFPASAAEIRQLGQSLVEHLLQIPDTHSAEQWTSANLRALRSFVANRIDVRHFPASDDSNQKGAFLWDYVAYQQGTGMLIVAESEHKNRDLQGLKGDFEKLFYAIAPIKLFMFRGDRDQSSDEQTENFVKTLRAYMAECCSRFMPGELYILYCRTWLKEDGKSGDRSYSLQIPGEPGKFYPLADSDEFVCDKTRSARLSV